MPLRRSALAAATVLVAVFVALAVPVSQLRTFALQKMCCCPDPDDCHCPPASHDDGRHDTMKRCHNTIADVIAGATPTVLPPELAPVLVPARVTAVIATPLARPHAPPAPARPDAPS